jgi:hypothetical protein
MKNQASNSGSASEPIETTTVVGALETKSSRFGNSTRSRHVGKSHRGPAR